MITFLEFISVTQHDYYVIIFGKHKFGFGIQITVFGKWKSDSSSQIESKFSRVASIYFNLFPFYFNIVFL